MSQLTALVVEDQFVIAMELEHRLLQIGFLVIGVASTGEAAIAMAREHRPHVILMDIQLSGDLDGVDAAGEIAAWHQAKIVFITANDDTHIRDRTATVPNSSYLTKPFTGEAFREALVV